MTKELTEVKRHPDLDKFESPIIQENLRKLKHCIGMVTKSEEWTSKVKYIQEEQCFYVDVGKITADVDCKVMSDIGSQTDATFVHYVTEDNIWRYYYSTIKINLKKEPVKDQDTLNKFKQHAQNQIITPKTELIGSLNQSQLEFARVIIYHFIATLQLDLTNVDFENESVRSDGFQLTARRVTGDVDIAEMVQLFLNHLTDKEYEYVIKNIDCCQNLKGFKFTIVKDRKRKGSWDEPASKSNK